MDIAGTLSRWSGVPLRAQGPALLAAVGHGGTHWVAGIFYVLLPFITRDLGLSYAEAGTLVAVFHGAAFVANCGSAGRSGRSSASHRRWNSASFPAAITNRPSLA